jgi:xanthine dehydrogenase YagT iron-sulfur-binding subunit
VDRILPLLSLLSRRRSLRSAGVATLRLASPSADAGTAAESASLPTENVALTVNGRPHFLDLDPRTTLLDALREHLALTGTKKGCDQGQCGACTVLVNGQRINSCLTLAMMHDGDEIVTIEGLAQRDDLHPM